MLPVTKPYYQTEIPIKLPNLPVSEIPVPSLISHAHFESLFAGAGLLQGPENRLQRQTTQTTALKAGKSEQGGFWPSHVRNMCLAHHV